MPRILLLPLLAWSLACSTPVSATATPDAAPDPRPGEAPTEVEVATVTAIPPPEMIAVVVPRQQIAVAPPVPATLAAVTVELGDEVDAGEVVARLDDHALRSALDEARGALRAARADARRAAVSLRQARARARRRDQLFRDGVVSQEETEDARFEVRRNDAALAAAASAVDGASAAVAQLERDLAAAAMTAPFAGRVAAIHHVAGAQVGPGTEVVTIVSDDALVRFAVPPDHAGAIQVGDDVVFAIADRRIPARITTVAPELDRAAHLLFATCELDLGDAPRPPLRTVGRVELAPR